MPPGRDDHLLGPGKKRVLSLDGGGTRGAIALAFLARIEEILRTAHGDDPEFRLADWFDLIGGTSTGAILAAGLALGKSVTELAHAYFALGGTVFRRRRWRLPGLLPRYDPAPLTRFLTDAFGDHTLDSAALRTGLAVVARRFDTGGTWLIANNPRAPFWNDPPDGSFIGNRHLPLVQVVRASAAAPGFFAPQAIRIEPGAPPGVFVDGALTPHNDPSLMLLMMTQLAAFGLRWPLDPSSLLLVSVGTGHFRLHPHPDTRRPASAAGFAVQTLLQAVADAQHQTLLMMQWMGDVRQPWPISKEIGTLDHDTLGGRNLFSFRRYDMPLEPDWLNRELSVSVTADELRSMRRLDNPAMMASLHSMAARAAGRQVRAEDLLGETAP